MKKLLAIILATALLVGMLPTVFAAEGDAAEQISVTYTFAKGGRSDASTETWFERAILDFETDGETTTDVVRETEKNPAFTSFPEASTNPNDQWAYVGATNGMSSSGTKSTSNGTELPIVEPGSIYLSASTVPGDGWIAFKIKVPATANYEITGLSAYVSKYSSSEMKMYIVPKSEALNTTLTNPATYGNLDTTYSSGSTSKYYATRENTTSFTGLGISSDYLVGTANLNATDAEVVDLVTIEGKVTDKKLLFLEADTEYFLFLHNANSKARTLFISSITLSEPAPDVTYTFTKGGRSDASTETWFERAILDFETDGETTTDVVRETEKNPAFTSFPEASTNPNDQWAYVGATNGMSSSGTKSRTNGTELPIVEPGSSYLSADTVPGDGWIAFKIKVPATANYEITGLSAYVFSNGSSETEVYIVPKSEALNTTLTNPATYGDFRTLLGGSSKYYVTRANAASFTDLGISSDYLVGTANLMGDANAVQDLITIEGKVTDKKLLFLEAGTEYFLFLHNANGKKRGMPVSSITLSKPEELGEPGEAIEDTNVSVAVLSENTDEGTVSWDGETIGEVNMGDTVTATATAKEGYVFRYWKNSSGQVLSGKAEESFVINTNSTITAVFDKVNDTSETVSVELYNANGMPFDNKTVNKNTTFAEAINGVGTPTYTGFGAFKHWSMYADESKIDDNMLVTETTRAVAIFNAPTETYTVSVNGTAEYSDVLYGTEVTVSSDASDFSYWKLGDEIVSYKSEYTFTVWKEVNLVAVTGEDAEEAPVAVLDEVDGNPLLIYSVPTDYTVVEAGILFGSTADITIYSVDGSRAAAARGTGQFTAQPKAGTTPAYSRGYLIFKNASGKIRILYAE